MVKDIYCGIKEVPKGKKKGDMKQCLQEGKVGYYGLKKIDPMLIKNTKVKSNKKRNSIKIWLDIVGIKSLIKNISGKILTEKDEKNKEEMKKKLAIARSQLQDLQEEYKIIKRNEEIESLPKRERNKLMKNKVEKIEEKIQDKKEEVKEIKDKVKNMKNEKSIDKNKDKIKKDNEQIENLKMKIEKLIKDSEEIEEEKEEDYIKKYEDNKNESKLKISEQMKIFMKEIKNLNKKELQLLKTKIVNKMEEEEEENENSENIKLLDKAYDAIEKELKLKKRNEISDKIKTESDKMIKKATKIIDEE